MPLTAAALVGAGDGLGQVEPPPPPRRPQPVITRAAIGRQRIRSRVVFIVWLLTEKARPTSSVGSAGMVATVATTSPAIRQIAGRLVCALPHARSAFTARSHMFRRTAAMPERTRRSGSSLET